MALNRAYLRYKQSPHLTDDNISIHRGLDDAPQRKISGTPKLGKYGQLGSESREGSSGMELQTGDRFSTSQVALVQDTEEKETWDERL